MTQKQGKEESKRKVLQVKRRFTKSKRSPYDDVEWEERTALIGDPDDPVFEQHNVEVPAFWSQNATNIVAQKYFAYAMDDPRRETSIKELIDRVVDKIAAEGEKRGYFKRGEKSIFADELRYILLHQMASFNSPVWFNIGVEGAPQTSSACFILSLVDSLESITEWYSEEARIFQAGSGSGINLSPLRGSMEPLSRGGYSSGPVTFMRAADASAGTIQSGGVTRRAAKMVILDIDHPDVEEFIWCKAREEERVRALRSAGFDMSMDSRNMAESTSYQNANNSVRVSDEFMKAVEAGEEWEFKARGTGESVESMPADKLLYEIAEAAWLCADPGMQYDSTIQDWHTTPAQGRISASNPCSEYMSNDNSSCNLASLNLLRFLSDEGSFEVEDFEHAIQIIFLAQEITISFADLPTRKISKNTKALRQIGIGYTNLGALLMSLGIAYDSDEGRDLAAAITALMTGESYLTSALIAERMGPFEYYEENKEDLLRVLEKHKKATAALAKSGEAGRIARFAKKDWNEALRLAKTFGVRNAQASVLAPTGCLASDSMVLTDKGLAKLSELGDVSGDRWQDVNFSVQTDEGVKRAEKFFCNGLSPAVSLTTSKGYSISGTPEHRVKRVSDGKWEWVRLSDVHEGDLLPIMLAGMPEGKRDIRLAPLDEPHFKSTPDVQAPEMMNDDLALLLGYFMGSGSLHSWGLRFRADKRDRDVSRKIEGIVQKLFALPLHFEEKKKHLQLEVRSSQLASWWKACSFARQGSEKDLCLPHVPSAVRATNNEKIYAAFLCGLFESRGGTYNKTVSFSSSRESFVREIKTMLLALGIPTSSKVDSAGKWGSVHVLRVLNRFYAQAFAEKIAFIGKRKNNILGTLLVEKSSPSEDYIPLQGDLIRELCPEGSVRRQNLLQNKGRVSRKLVRELFQETGDQRLSHLLCFYYDTVKAAELGEEIATFDLSVPENVTYIANGLVSHNTISFMMDCDTTGIEPDFALIKHKVLVGGGSMSIVNGSVPRALKHLGYSSNEIDDIVNYIEEEIDLGGGMKGPRGTIEGAPHITDDHVSVFDCAVGERAIAPQGHVEMMSVVQPFLSGAISKTVNVPSSASVDDIAELYLEGWRKGLKALAIYRDGSKANQPLSEKKSKIDEESAAEERLASLLGDGLRRGERHEIPKDAKIIGTKFEISSSLQQPVSGYIHVRLFEDGTPGGIFIDVGQAGSTLHGFIRAWSVTIGLGLQYGLPLDILVSKLAFAQFEPAGFTDDPQIRTAKSIVDYVIRWLALQFLDSSVHQQLGILSQDDQILPEDEEGIPGGAISPLADITSRTIPAGDIDLTASLGSGICDICSGTMVRTGACMTCTSCGNSGGCG